MKLYYKSIGIENDHMNTSDSDPDFLLLVQRAVLLGLKEAGYLCDVQYRQAEETLLRRHKTRPRND